MVPWDSVIKQLRLAASESGDIYKCERAEGGCWLQSYYGDDTKTHWGIK